MSSRDFVLDFKIAKQKALHEWALGLIDEVLNDKCQKRTQKEKFEVIRDIILDATECEEEI
jgi:hypothetical protein